MVLVAKKSLKFEEKPKINIYSLVPQIDHPVALCTNLLTYWRPHEAGLHANEDGCDIDLVQDDQSWNIEDSDKRLPIGNVPIAAWGTSLKRTGIPTSLTRPQNR